ncbi:ABC transporter ATP-binding protein [Microvirga guangxiensis]|uniref:sn-glycerol 3-phosphate transport system ATP-binding protein n=1 Tax=Microvirga guangxiensis TaxID=549386 RepID=A0A1G5KEV4_9HYPH|nr:sn-glycerol-3-phosphate ABC transporter ATP-binding protein UgpC [Microvirga guangxiensis]SCY99175.1 sn-glycerol 3-phosphate transport system ATP-binding protein [Microvirga guangxiensis]
MADIDIRSVRKAYGKNQVVHGVDLSIRSGEFVVVLGPSGCGKSTLLRMIAGLEAITAGEIAIAGDVVNNLEPRERGCAMVFQNYALYPHMTVAENIGYGLKVAGLSKPERTARVETVAKSLGLSEYLDRKPGQLSGGQRQRVAMGRAMIREPKVFLFDEPLSNLDAKLRVQMRIEIRKLHNRLGTTSVFVTHDQVEAMTLADRVVVMNGGHIEQVGTPEEIYRNPASRFVAGFIGSPPMNLFDGRVTGPGEVQAHGIVLSVPHAGLKPGRPVTIGIRPEEVVLGAAGSNVASIDVDFSEELGSVRLLHGQVAGADFVIQVPATTAGPKIGRFSFEVPARAVHLFDAETGNRIGTAASGARAAA